MFKSLSRKQKITALVLAAALLLGLAAWGISALVRGPAVLSYRSLSISEGTFNYLYSYFRYRILVTFKAEGVTDTQAFWDAPYDDTQTNGDFYGDMALTFVYQTVIAARTFDRESSLSVTDRNTLKTLQEEVLSLDYKGGGSKEAFNEKARAYGFDYGDFCDGTLLLYKASKAKGALYGKTGVLAPKEELNGYLKENYVRIKMIFVRTKDRFVFDSEGNYISENGVYVTEPLPPDILAEKEQTIAALKANLADGITEVEFDTLFSDEDARYNDDSSCPAGGYFFSESAAYTKAYKAAFPAKEAGGADIVSTALSLEVGQSAVVESEFGTHFLLACAVSDDDYKLSSNTAYGQMFSDFYENAATALFADLLEREAEHVRVRDRDFIDALSFPATKPNKELWIAF